MQPDEPHANATSKDYDLRLSAQLLKPSVLSGMLTVLISLAIVLGVVVITNYRGSSFEQDLLGYRQQQEQQQVESDYAEATTNMVTFIDEATGQEITIDSGSVTDNYDQINSNFADSNLVRNIPVMAFWMFVGTLVYFIVTGVSGALSSVRELGDELNYVHVKRKELLHEVYMKLAVRFAALVVWLIYIMVFFRMIVPYVLAASHVGAAEASIKGLPYAVLAFVVMTVAMHIHAIMVRLVVLRPRLFSQETSF